ncbi:MAG: hypothetical protein IPK65_01645 [Gammaproteobacteria bacterium]|nr:hypothetical protein [Gammaproteobacteria bacterium]
MKSKLHILILLAGALFLCFPAFAASLPDYYPERFDRWGVIDQINLDKQIIVVNDVNVRVTRDLRIYTVNTRFATLQSLKPGMKIGFGTTGSRSLSGAVSEVWILPADYTPPQVSNSVANERRKGRE